MMNWPKPSTLKALRAFLGLTGYYQKFIQNFGKIVRPLTKMLKKDSFSWTPAAEEAFKKLKEAMTKAPVLALPDFSKKFIIECDASGLGIGAILMQERPIAFFNQALQGKNLLLSTYEKEILALVLAVQKWRLYLLGRQFIVKTDHQSLKYLWSQRITTTTQQKWLYKLMRLDFIIEYKKGKENVMGDFLLRREEIGEAIDEESGGRLTAITQHVPNWVEAIKQEIESSVALQELFQCIKDGEAIGPWKIMDGVIFFKEKIYLKENSSSFFFYLNHEVSWGGPQLWEAPLSPYHNPN
ncbi:hypothetical protein AB3S75_033777 [Citrus x aurantiifolia]